jgi:hypothetical protein
VIQVGDRVVCVCDTDPCGIFDLMKPEIDKLAYGQTYVVEEVHENRRFRITSAGEVTTHVSGESRYVRVQGINLMLDDRRFERVKDEDTGGDPDQVFDDGEIDYLGITRSFGR